MNYAALQVAVQDYTENTFSSVDFATMTQLAEQKIYNSVQLPIMRKTQSLSLTGGSNVLNAPSDFLNAFSLAVIDSTGAYNYLVNKDANFIYEAYPTPATTGTPKYYAINGPQAANQLLTAFILGPTPTTALASGGSATLTYSYYPETIVTAGSTWLSTNFDSVLFNGVMVEAIRFMKGEQDMVALYADQYKQSLTLFKNLVDGKLRQDAYRNGQVRTQVI
jgi:hypothetical protein